ncbi:MAG TPA: SigE family RNA polymerase sigma factor [Nocardioidaceae bacterium]|nr:SigE family RNA polymerase sigma factor [Nocardioidaceae bacterium]
MSAPRWDADEAVTQLYAAHYRSLVRMAALLVRHSGEAEEIVQDAFVAMHGRWRRLHEPDHALAYLRQSVVNRARSAHRHHQVVDKHTPRYLPDEPSPEQHVLRTATREAVMGALRELPQRQREVLVLRYFSELSEAEIADALGISRGAVKSHASRGTASLRQHLDHLLGEQP